MSSSKDRLDSWKEIAVYVNHDIGTCIKWKKVRFASVSD
jgi:hypothetical protein